ncbi:type IX secretion system outer membrane channel protein PorV [Ferruginibacter lapsinanis]|uniref:type IX secretion system outer membrane channel protein PorV n=1 Tax=Ferruginibacter lapsinanis TaxID=563172 RepID=UPI001E64B2D0|nr:type IX secretion system outer membrane channel protein PorV [Ferruginibacter lapsinanis]UEG50243.1 type IX secretion system outer membrane channel protein PorV [Ferruginibacter lapsinanis]
MKRAKLKLTGLLLLVSIAGIVNAQEADQINVVTSAVPFLRISPDARSGGMGDVGVATTPDASSGFWNLAKTPFNTSQAGICLTYTPWLKDLGLNDVNLITAGGYYKLDEMQAVTASIRYFNLGNIQFTDFLGNELGSFRPREFSIDAGYSRKLSSKLGIGIALRYINSRLASGDPNNSGTSYKPGSSVAGDLSLFHTGVKDNGEGLNYGIALTNLGSKIAYTNDASQKDYIPANLGLGVAYTKVMDEANKLTFALDVHKLLVPTPPVATGVEETDQANLEKYRTQGVVSSWFKSFGDAPGGFKEELREFQISAGAEYWYNNQFALRGGYFYEHPTKGNRKYFSLGAGLKYNNFGLNFSYLLPSGNGTNRNPLSNTLRFSLVFDFDGTAGSTTTPTTTK